MKIEAEELKIRKALNLGGKATEYAGTIEELIADVSSLIQSEQARVADKLEEIINDGSDREWTATDEKIECLLKELSPNKDIKE